MENMLLLAVVVGGVLIMGVLLKRFMPKVFNSVGSVISGTTGTMGSGEVSSYSSGSSSSKDSHPIPPELTTEAKVEAETKEDATKSEEERVAPTVEGGGGGGWMGCWDGNPQPHQCPPKNIMPYERK